MDTQSNTAPNLAPPTIRQVTDSEGNLIPTGGTTGDTKLTLPGTYVSEPGGEVIIVDNGDEPGYRVWVSRSDTWEKVLTLALGDHSFTVRAPNGPVSQPWLVTIVAA